MRYNKKRKYRIFGDGCNSLPAVIVTDYLAGWWVIELEQFSNMLQVIETAYIAIDKSEHKREPLAWFGANPKPTVQSGWEKNEKNAVFADILLGIYFWMSGSIWCNKQPQ